MNSEVGSMEAGGVEGSPTLIEEVEKHRKELIFENQKLRQDNAQLQYALEQSEAAVLDLNKKALYWRSIAKEYESEARSDASHVDLREGFER